MISNEIFNKLILTKLNPYFDIVKLDLNNKKKFYFL